MLEDAKFDAVVIGGGPAGSTVATLLARAGLNVAVFESKSFPRFHIGESLLPASLPILDELGVHEQIRKLFMIKPGGKWYYGDRAMFSDFSQTPPDTSFAKVPYAYMVKRDDFDDILLKNAEDAGADVYHEHSVVDLIMEGTRVVGVVVKDPMQVVQNIACHMVFDCSGYGAVIANKLRLRKVNRLKRMAVFGHYETKALNEDLKNGWFVGQMVYNGWLWLIPLKSDLISIGIVIPLDAYKEAQQSPQDFLEGYIRRVSIAKSGIAPNPKLQGKVHVYGNLGYTTTRAFGEGWVLVGDAAFFIDPCYSSGVHLALSSGKEAASLYLEQRRNGRSQADHFEKYEKSVRNDEKLVLRFVDSFYMASRNRFLQWLIPATTTDKINRQFVTVTGGDFSRRPSMINAVYYASKLISMLLPIKAK